MYSKGRFRKKFMTTVIISVLIIGCFFNCGVLGEEQDVKISIFEKPKIDIVLAKSKTNTNLTNFETQIRSSVTNELQNHNFGSPDLKIQAVDAQNVEFTDSFNWKYDMSNTIGSITPTNNGRDVTMKGNRTERGKNCMYIIPSGNKEQVFTFHYKIEFGDSFNGAGMLLRVKDNGTTLTGYLLSFNNPSYYMYYGSGNNNGGLWKFTWRKGTNGENLNNNGTNYSSYNSNTADIKLVKGLSINTEGDLTVSATETEIKIVGAGVNVTQSISSSDSTLGNGYGFFSDHYNHNCERIGEFTLTGINLQESSVKSFSEVLRMPEWRAGAYRFLVYVDDNINEELQTGTGMGELISRLINDNIYFVGWSTSKNRNQIDSLIEMNNGQGKNIDNSSANLQASCNSTATYIREVLNSIESSQYILVDEPVKIEVSPAGIDTNTIEYPDWPYGKWSVEHEYQYFDNDMGQYDKSGQHTSDMIKSFDKTGRYEIKYKDASITPKDIYVHRKPQADFTMQVNGTTITLNSTSFDEDKQITGTNNGISEVEWQYKKVNESSWTKVDSKDNNVTITIQQGQEYQVQLRVKDFQETWSDPKVKYTTNNTNVKPMASFSFASDTISKYETLSVIDSSYDPAGGTIVAWQWDLYKGSSSSPIRQNQSTPTTNFNQSGLGNGDYKMALRVQNSKGLWSETYYRTFKVTNDMISPEFIAEPTNSDWTKNDVKINFRFKDRGGSGFNSWKYAITDSESIPSTYSGDQTSSSINESGETIDDLTVTEEGQKYVHVVAKDNDGNLSINRILGPYKIDHSNPVVQVTADFTTIRTNPLDINIHSTDKYSGIKKVTFNGQVLEGTENTVAQVSKNGTYNLQVEDVAGNIYTEDIVVNNIYVGCTAGLNHPIYSSTMDSCPICDSIKGLEVTKEKEIYNAQEQKVSYVNPGGGTIVEYYNGSKTKPVEAGTYQYELKVIYKDSEYSTGKTGEFVIEQKNINIQNIVAENREYDGTTIVKLSGGELVGVEDVDIDKVKFTLSATGTIENKNIGKYNVTIPNITLSDTKAKNYKLIQPELGEVKVEIYKRKTKVEGITANNRQYNGTTIVELNRGNLTRIVEGDIGKVDYNLSATGSIPNKDIGQYKVTIPEITLTGEESNNYEIIQPGPEEVDVEIIPKDINVTGLKAEDKEYDGTTLVNLIATGLVGVENGDIEEVDLVLPEKGTVESKNVGEYDVTIPEITLSGEEIKNYNLRQPILGEVKVEIYKRETRVEGITANNRQYNATTIVELNRGNLTRIVEGDIEKVDYELSPTGSIPNKNIGEYKVTIPEITLTGEESDNYEIIQPDPEEVDIEITPKEINITEIKAEDREYDGTTVVAINGGELVGVEAEDIEKVEFILSETGTIENKDIGEYDVTIPEITLTGEEASNYTLIQPQPEEVKVTINKRKLTIEDLKGKDRKYDKTDVVEIVEGKLKNVVEGEDVKAVYPKEGKIPNKNIGKWEVTIEDIVLEGKDIDNYELIQPKTEDIEVTIIKPDEPKLQTKTEITKVNDKEIKEKETPEIRYGDKIQLAIRVYNNGTGNGYAKSIKEIIPEGLEYIENEETNKENGWKVVDKKNKNILETEILNFDSGEKNELEPEEKETNKTEKETEKTEETNKTKDEEETKEETSKTKDEVDKEDTEDTEKTKDEEEQQKDEINKTQDEAEQVKDVSKIENKTKEIEKANETKDEEEQEDTEKTKDKEEQEEADKTKDETDKTNKTEEKDKIEEKNYKEVLIELVVTKKDRAEEVLENIVQIEQTDIIGEEIEYKKGENEEKEPIKISYTDFAIDIKVKEIEDINANGQELYKIQENSSKLAKVEIHRKQIGTSKVKVKYEISITNEGDNPGKVDKIIEYIPKNMALSSESAKDWKAEGTNTVVCENITEEIDKNETISKEIVLEANANNIIGTNSNTVILVSEDDKDQRILEGTKEKTTIGKENSYNKENYKETNNYGEAGLIVSIKTGREANNSIIFLIIYLLISLIVIIYIRHKFKKFYINK